MSEEADTQAAAERARRVDAQAKLFDAGAATARAYLTRDTPERAAVLANLAEGHYTRASDIETDLADLERRGARAAHAESDAEVRRRAETK